MLELISIFKYRVQDHKCTWLYDGRVSAGVQNKYL
jgi:hypothetical protein